MLDDIIEVIELVLNAVFGMREVRKELDNDLTSLMRQAHEGKSLSGALISTDGLTPERLCCPLTAQQLRDMRACTQVTQHHLSFDVAKSKGFRHPHIVVLVTVDFEGVTGTGAPVSIHVDHAPVHVTLSGKHPFVIDDIASYPMA